MRLPIRARRFSSHEVTLALGMLPLFALIHVGAYWLRFDGVLGELEWERIRTMVTWIVAVKTLSFIWFRIYQGWSRYVTFHDMLALGQAAMLGAFITALGDYLLFAELAIPRGVFLLDWGITAFTVGGLRCLPRLVWEGRAGGLLPSRLTPVFIVGANDSGEALLREIRRNPNLPYRVVGFINESPTHAPACIGGVPVLGQIADTCELSAEYGVREVLITAGELSGQQVRSLLDAGERSDVRVKVLPGLEQLLRQRIDWQPRTVAIEDLLRRQPVKLDQLQLHEWIDGRSLLVTGSAGSIGSEICRQLLQFSPRRLVFVDRAENGQFFLQRELERLGATCKLEFCVADVSDGRRMSALFREHKPDIVFHAAAYKHVPLMEANPGEAIKNIVGVTRLLADLAHQQHVSSFVQISTDKAVNPTSVMGACKRVAERYVQALAGRSDCRFVTVRFGNVLDSAGSVVPIFREQIARGGPVTVTHPEMRRFFMTIPEASQLVIQAGAMGHGGEIFVLDMGDPVRIVDLAIDMIRLSGFHVGDDIAIEYTGLRPGEKLYEELLMDGEHHLPTSHPKILVAAGHQESYEQVRKTIERLENVSESPTRLILAHLARAVPEYRRAGPEIQRPRVRAA